MGSAATARLLGTSAVGESRQLHSKAHPLVYFLLGGRVMVMADGFAWNGQTYDSLSKLAFAITGTKWNGPRFFGLRVKEDRLDSGDRS
jgi:Protein of unknown function (DUF2924)